MTTIRKTIALTDQQNDWVKARITSGDFTNDSEYFRDLIRRDQERNAGLAQLRSALVDGEQGGISEHTPDDIRSAVKEKLGADGQLLHFLVEDLAAHPERLQAVDAGLVQRIKSLVGDVNVDLNEPLPENDE